ncbi:MAG: hypothetical protein HOM19_08860 [Candidatus Marinimicrobia bacterium]|jgi:hypothetical protein|nr:hypothetical protein [Candidatus Neomarinimicrobiota bacterium]
MRTQVWKNNCGSFSAVRDKNGKIEVLVNGKNWRQRSGAKRDFLFGKQKAMMGLEMLDEIEEYISSEGEWPDWNGAKVIDNKNFVKTLEKFGHDWESNTGYIKISGVVNQMNFKFQFGIEKARAFYCAAIDIEDLVG